MDIRNFFKKRGHDDDKSEREKPEKVAKVENMPKTEEIEKKCELNDIGYFVGHSDKLNDNVRKDMLQNPYVPDDDYDFKSDATDAKRVFKKSWLNQYSP